ncbi:MAG TPA: hypothetical protein VGR28_04255 [Candidatus Thermoplasmatota archaeon]|nr:hypothetical protein [Candidatus Thermoplasmatota archaeon]
MTQVLKPTRVTHSLLLVALLLAPAIAVLGPVEAQVTPPEPPTPPSACTSKITKVVASPFYAETGQTIEVTVFLGVTQEGGSGVVDLNITIERPDGTAISPFDPDTVRADVPGSKKFSFTAGSEAGRGDINASLLLVPSTQFGTPPTNYCAPDLTPGSGSVTWGYWVNSKPDLRVTEVNFVEHFDAGANAPETGPGAHEPLSSLLNYTRYPTVTTGTTPCSENSPSAPSQVHFNITLANDGDAGFFAHPYTSAGGDHTGGLPLRIATKDGLFPVGSFLGDLYKVYVAPHDSVHLILNMSNYSMVGKAGLRSLQVIVDSDGAYPETEEGNNAFPADPTTDHIFDIAAPDLVGEWVTQPTREGDNVKGQVRMSNAGSHFAGSVLEAGTAAEVAGICHSRDGDAVWARVYVDVADANHELFSFQDNLTAGETGEGKEFTSAQALKAGVHSIVLVVDAANRTGRTLATELNETNNRVVAETEIAVLDVDTPAIGNVTCPTNPPCTGRANARINISGILTDDADFTDTAHNHIFVNVTYPDSTNLAFPVVNDAIGGIVANASDAKRYEWWFNSSYAQEGSYSIFVQAQDAVHNVSSSVFSLLLTDFPKIVESVAVKVCTQDITTTNASSITCNLNHTAYVPPGNFTPGGQATPVQVGNALNLTFRVPPDATGLANEWKSTARKTIALWDADGNFRGNYTVQPVCWNNATANTPAGAQEVACDTTVLPNGQPSPTASVYPCTDTSANCYNFTFRAAFALDSTSGGEITTNGTLSGADLGCNYNPSTAFAAQSVRFDSPGPWNVTMWVGDAGSPTCGYRANGFPGTPLYIFELWAAPNTTITGVSVGGASGNSINALTDAVVRANLTVNTTAGPLKAAVVDVYRSNGTADVLVHSFNMTHPGGTYFDAPNRTGIYEARIGTGLGSLLDQAGSYRWVIGVKDANHTWSYSNTNGSVCSPSIDGCNPTKFLLVVQDTRSPTVANAQVNIAGAPGIEVTDVQATTNISFSANVDDDTRITVEAVVQRDNGAEVLRLPMARLSNVSTVYATDNVTTGPGSQLPEGAYRLIVHVVDSANNPADSPVKTFTVAGNLGPSYSNLSPAPGAFGARGGSVSVDVSDPLQGVRSDTIEVRVGPNGTATEPVLLLVKTPLDANPFPHTVRVSFQLGSQFGHGANVAVNVTAKDGSPDQLTGSVQWNFTVDGQPPRTTVSCSRSFPVPCGTAGQQVVVRGDTNISLVGTDADPIVVSGLKAVRYTVEAAGQAVSTQDVPGSSATFTLAGRPDGSYTVRFQSLDNAGNAEPERSMALILDTQGPQVQNVVRSQTPGGANVSAIITDLYADVANATLFFRTDVAGYQPVAMQRLGETRGWFAELGSTRRGTRVCYYIEASDFLGNTGSNGSSIAPECFTAENHPPRLQVLEPSDGESVGSTMTVRWDTGDLDGDPVSVALSLRRSGDVQLRAVPLSNEEQGRRVKSFSTTDLVPGPYQVRLDAVDNQPFNNRTTRVLNVTLGGNASSGTPIFDSATIDVGQQVRVRVTIAKAVADIQAQLLRDGRIVDRAPMDQNPPGSTTYEATFIVREPGVYRVVVVGTYADGQPFEIQGASTLTVRGGGIGLDALVIVGLAAVVVVLAGAGLRRRGL